ncbi:hypothetical protein [Micropruina glycogenica]|uniref:Uncharacterized protein n=1 Tax=Micropruina glycogenica TaxID=75385 RepID=A0A2N9JMD1_9ACTN|nr:hypothetical protein [Micropruina glycogenica]SPD88926.1 membrane protein of unknown function [Micropruina glycogenica]
MTLPNEPQPAERDQTAESSGWTPVPGSAPMVPAAGSLHDSAPFGTPPPLPNAAPSATGPRIVGGVLLALGALAVWWGGPALGAFESPTLDVFRFNPLRLMAGFFGPFAVVVGLGALGGGLSRKGQPARPDALTWVSVALMIVLGLGLLVWGLPGIGDLIGTFSHVSYDMPRVRMSRILAVMLGLFATLVGVSALRRFVRGG